MIKLVAVDMDGTFLDDQMHYNRTIFRKIYNYFKENDIYFVVASGNQYYQLKSFFDDYQDEITYISENGAYIIENKKEIFFTPQGAFGTWLHETTQDILKFIVEEDFEGKSLLDLGTGSGILSIAAGVKGASKIVAVDIRDVEDEVLLNASLNELENIEVVVGNVLHEEYKLDEKFDWIFINIGGEETAMFMDFIEEHIEKTGKLLVSGLVEWSFDWGKEKVENKGFKLNKKFQTNEWCTAIFSK